MHINYKLKYLGIIFILFSGYFFLYNFSDSIEGHTVCLFKNVTGIPCPACGSTRATIQLLHGEFLNSILINPFGILTNILITVSIFWMIIDIVKNKETFFQFSRLDWNNRIKFFALLIVLVNWIWNIEKGI
jgi:hypothetical protein